MGLEETLDQINAEWRQTTHECSERYREAVQSTLESLGLWGVDVYSKRTGKRGRLDLRISTSYGARIAWEIVLVPYKKDGTLGEKLEPIYVFTFTEENILKEISKENPNG